ALIAASSSDLEETEPHGDLTICCAEGIGSFWFSRRIGLFASQFPKVSIKLITPGHEQDVYRNNIDLSIVYGDGNWKDMQVHLLYPLTFFPVCSPRLVENLGKISKPESLTDYRLLHHIDHSNWSAWLAAAKARNVDSSSGIIFSDINHSLSAAIAGHGIAIADNVLANDSLNDGSLIKLFDKEIPGPKSYYLVVNEEKSKQPACSACVEWILSEIR
ncbi:MAG: LysR family glycine cleavage system transcriptional activator, partial [Gammaproteobacteria bacterium]